MKRLSAIAAAIGFALALPAAAQTKWDLPTAYPASNFHTENVSSSRPTWRRRPAASSRSRCTPNASLFKAPEIKRAVQGGQAQAGEILLVNFENEDPLYGLDGIPFLATSYADSMKLYKSSRKALDDKFAKQGMKLLYTVPWPPQGIYTKRTLASVNDMKGLKWRAYSPATSKIAELVGAQPVTVQAAEVSQALATGVIDSYMSSGATGYDSKTYEHIKNWYDTQAWLPKNAVIVNAEGVRRARQADAGGRDEGRRGRRNARLEAVRGEERLVHRAAQGQGHDDHQAVRAADGRPAQGRQLHARRVAAQGRRRREEGHRELPLAAVAHPAPPDVRTFLDRLYNAAGYLAALFLVGTLAMVLTGIAGRLLHFHVPGTDSYAGYCMAASGFLALAHTLKRGDHIRVTLILEHLGVNAQRGLELWALGAATLLAALFAYFSVRLAFQSWQFNDVSTGNDATPLWIPQLTMAAGTVVLLVAFVDDFVLELKGGAHTEGAGRGDAQ